MSSPPDFTPPSFFFDVLILIGRFEESGAWSAVLPALPAELPAVLVAPPPGSDVALLAEHLRRQTSRPVQLAEEGTLLHPGQLYLSSPRQMLEVSPGARCRCHVTPPREEPAAGRPLDRLLASVAVGLGERALVVVVGGEAPDGVAGLRALRGTGGTVLVASPDPADPAAPAGLAHALIAAGAADLVVEPQRLGGAVSDLLSGQRPQRPGPARATERRSGERFQVLLTSIADDLQRLTTPDEIIGAVGRRLGEALNLNSCFFSDVDEERGVVTVDYAWQRGSIPGLRQTFRIADFMIEDFVQSQRAGETYIVRDTVTDERIDAEACARLSVGSTLAVPFHHDGRWVACLTVTDASPRDWRADELEVVREAADLVFPRLERARAEEALRQSEEKYRTLFGAMGQGYTLCEVVRDETGRATDLRLLELNPAYERLMGVSAEVARGGRVYDLFPKADRWWLENYDRIVRSGRSERLEYRYNDLGDWFEAWVYPQGEDRFVALFENITERKQRELQQAYRLKLGDALRPLGDPVEIQGEAVRVLGQHLGSDRAYYVEVDEQRAEYVVEHEWHRGGVTSHARRYPLGAWTMPWLENGKPWVVRDVDTDPDMPDDQRASYRGNDVAACVVVPLLKNGRLVATLVANETKPRDWTEAEVALLVETAERTWAATDRARAEAALADSEGRLRALIEHLPGGAVFVVNQDLRYLLAQGKALGTTGHRPEEVVGRTVLEVMGPALAPEYEARYRQALAGESFEYEHAAHHRVFITRGVPLRDAAGAIYAVLAMSYDITARKRAEDEVRALNATLEQRVAERTRRLADLNAELGNLITRTAHNLEAPAQQLNHLLGAGSPIDLHLLDGLASYDPAALTDEMTRLRGVAQDLRQLSDLEERALSSELLPLAELFEEVRTEALALSKEQVDWTVKALPIVRGDRTLLRQALEVLMTFTLSETRGARYVTVSSRQIEGEVQITVQDDGIGLNGEEAATLFDLAVRTEHSVPVLEGSGLIQVRRILARHGGWAWAESQRSSGKIVLAFPKDAAVTEFEALFRQDKPESP